MIKHIFKLIWNKKRSNALMILEIFLSFLVLFAVLSYVLFNMKIVNAPMGFETKDRWMVYLDDIDQLDSLEATEVIKSLRQEMLALDEIEDVSFTHSIAPFANSHWRTGNDDNGFNINGLVTPTDLKLKDVLDLNIIQGRWFNEDDFNSAIKPIIVNKIFVDRFFPDKDMLDSTFIFDGERKLIGIVDDYRYNGEFEDKEPTTFELSPYVNNRDCMLLKMKPNVSANFEEKLSKVLLSVTKTHGNVIQTLEKMRKADSRESWLMLISMLTICGFLCLNVALGLFGVLWYNISKRKSEIGLRQAVGAYGFEITKQFILEIIIMTSIALLLGLFFTVQLPLLNMTEYEDSLFYQSMFYASMVILILVFICALFPSLQAARITPSEALHED